MLVPSYADGPVYELRLIVRQPSGGSTTILAHEAHLEFSRDELDLLTRWACSLAALACQREESRYCQAFRSEAGGTRTLLEMRNAR